MKQKLDPLVEQGRRVFVSYENHRAFDRQYSYRYLASKEFLEWLETNCGPRGVLWTAIKNPTTGGFDFYFAVDQQAMLFKLTWG
jgi:hypothetical protein